MDNDIAIIGISVELPGVRGTHELWDLISSGRNLTRPFPAERRAEMVEFIELLRSSAISEVTDRSLQFHNGSFLDRIDNFDPDFFGMTPKHASTMDPHLRMIMRNMYVAAEDAGYVGDRIRGSRTGVFVGFAANPGQSYMEYYCRIDPTLSQVGLTGSIPTMLANRMSHFLDVRGPSLVVDTACSASLVAVHLAKTALLVGDCEMAIVAGARYVGAPLHHPLNDIGIESSDGMTRTFDELADGTGLGEGSAAVVLKRLDRAIADGDQVYAVIKGSAVNHDGATNGVTTPDAAAQAALLLAAWDDAGIDPRTLGYLEVHGTATRIGDPIEFEGLRQAFGQHTDDRQFCAVGTVKANAGHLFEGSGILGLIKAALTLDRRTIPPLANFNQPNSRIDFANGPVYIPTTPRPWPAGATPHRSGVSAFGLGGTNCHVVLEEYAQPRPATPSAGEPYLFTLSAHTERSLRRLVREYVDHIDLGALDGENIADVCYTTNVSRSGHRHRLGLVVSSLGALRERLAALAEDRPADASPVFSTVPQWASQATPGTGLERVAAEYAAGGPLDWRPIQAGRAPRTVGLPPYEFDERRCWVDLPADWRTRFVGVRDEAPQPITHDIVFDPEPVPAATLAAADVRALALVDPAAGAGPLLTAAGLGGLDVLRLAGANEDPVGPGGGVFHHSEADYGRVAELIVDGGYSHVVFALGSEAAAAADAVELDRRVRKNLSGLFLLTRALINAAAQVTLVVLTRSALAAAQGDPVVAENAALVGLAKVIAREYPYLRTRSVDIDAATAPAQLRAEILADRPGLHLLRGPVRYRELFTELPEIAPTGGDYLRPGGTYLITGGTGAIGLAVCRAFAAAQPGINLVLLSRSGAPHKATWAALAAARGVEDRTAKLAQALRELELLGAAVHVRQADAGDPDALTRVVDELRDRFGRLDGIVHAAGVPGLNLIAFRTLADFEAVVRPKLHAAFALDQATRDDRPDFIAYFSSVAAVFPASGQGDYAAANYYLDNLARANADPRCHVLSLDWVAWKEIGMAVEYGTNTDTTFKAIPTAQGLSILDAGLRSDRSRVFAGEVHYEGDIVNLLSTYDIALSDPIAEKISDAVAARAEQQARAAERIREAIEALEVELTGRPDGDYSEFEVGIARCWAEAFGFPTVDVNADFFDLGGDSIMAISLVTNIGTYLGVQLDAADLLVERTVAGLAAHLAATQPEIDGIEMTEFDDDPQLVGAFDA
ncbi:SDR family NAD(P)-dependent oxidoreductase [Micromonospora sp. CPCC 205371]|nr:SDR family NAD(P)-dependent oxidoreductase [Micromonospora sp. CPCC 205371]